MKISARKKRAEDGMEIKKGRYRGYTSLSEVNLIHLVNDGNLEAKEELLRRMIQRIQRKGGETDGTVTKT